MIIDFHRHLWSLAERYASARDIAARGSVLKADVTSPQDGGGTPQRVKDIVAEMETAGVDKSVLLLADYGLRLGEPEASIWEENKLAADVAKDDEHFIAFCGVDPRRKDAAEIFEKALTEWGAKGLKLHPCAGYSPSDPACGPLYELAGQHGVPVAVHSGPMASPLLSEWANPINVDQAAADFPGTNFVILHSGERCWFPVALDMARWKPNIYLELSLWQIEYTEDQENFTRTVQRIRKAIGLERVVFGSDLPGIAKVMSLVDWVGVFRALPGAAARHGGRITEADVTNMLGGNAARLLGVAG